LKISKVLYNRGYSVEHQDDGWVICEKVVESEELNHETKFLKALVTNFEDSEDKKNKEGVKYDR
jgi:hypothetical protein